MRLRKRAKRAHGEARRSRRATARRRKPEGRRKRGKEGGKRTPAGGTNKSRRRRRTAYPSDKHSQLTVAGRLAVSETSDAAAAVTHSKVAMLRGCRFELEPVEAVMNPGGDHALSLIAGKSLEPSLLEKLDVPVVQTRAALIAVAHESDLPIRVLGVLGDALGKHGGRTGRGSTRPARPNWRVSDMEFGTAGRVSGPGLGYHATD